MNILSVLALMFCLNLSLIMVVCQALWHHYVNQIEVDLASMVVWCFVVHLLAFILIELNLIN